MTNGTAHPQANARGGGMTMRVYTVNRHGTMTQGTVSVVVGSKLSPLPATDCYPPCQCPLHRAGQAVSR
ncbi:hypothetical protein [Streptomyces murinus]|uniref:hypothetical protein n=1 Tax=Streptomyces murinus TaxID=33900 RepID=UPI002E0F5F72|nr:hypothetical protein OG516_05105 [Streptomyces murinus]